MDTRLSFDSELLSRYQGAGPRYTSYPSAPAFSAGFGEAKFRHAAQRSNEDPIPSSLSLYVHVPYCFSPCFYCGCNRVISRDRSKAAPYIARLQREIEMVSALFDSDREVSQIHFGGGTPNFLDATELRQVMDTLSRRFTFSIESNRDFSIELDPRYIDPTGISALAELGFNRASLGVQDFDPQVQQAVNRLQPSDQTMALVDACRKHDFKSVNIDLIYGLPRQCLEGFARTLDIVLQHRPDRLAVYGYAHMPTLFKAQRQIEEAELPSPADKLSLLQLAIEKLSAEGYCYIGMDLFALPEDELAQARLRGDLHRNFMGYTTHADSDLIGFGVSAISHISDSFSQNPRDMVSWEAAIDAGKLPVWRGLRLSDDDLLRADIIQGLMCHGQLNIAALEQRYDIRFKDYFAYELKRLEELEHDGLVVRSVRGFSVTERGRLLVRVVASCFDHYLPNNGADAVGHHSKVI